MRRKSFIASILSNKKLIAIFLVVIIFLISFPIFENKNKRQKIDLEILELEKEISGLETKNQDLKKLIDYLDSDQFTEEQARLNLGMKKPGEEVVVVANDSNRNDITNNEASIVINNLTKPQRWWMYFFAVK